MPTNPGPVIVVDDDAAVRNSLKFALELEGLHVQVYAGAAQLLAEREMPAGGCLVIDYHMPSMDGIDLVSALRLRHVALPAILITTKATSDLRRRAANAGFEGVLEKPLEDGSLMDSIRLALGPASSRPKPTPTI